MDGDLDGRVIGEIGVAIAVERLLRAGYHVAIPIVDDGYDLLAFADRRHWRIQVKSSACKSSDRRRIRITRGQHRNKRYSHRHVDAFIAVHIETNTVMCIPVSATEGRRWLSWSSADKWSDMGVLRRIKQQRC